MIIDAIKAFVLSVIILIQTSMNKCTYIYIYTLRQKLSTTLYCYRYIFLHQYCSNNKIDITIFLTLLKRLHQGR